LTLTKKQRGKREYSAASLASRESYQFGRFEAVMKPVKAAGVVTAFFLHRSNPWQEIDLEFLGRDTTRILVNVYFNPGEAGTGSNYGNRGTPVMIDLGFDAAEDFHRYTIEWEPHEIRWFVDNELVHVRAAWEPTPVPNLPLQLHCSIWPPRSTELAGEIGDGDLTVSSQVKSITVSVWTANLDESLRA
jgi:beta-glucanase (GH16 family)